MRATAPGRCRPAGGDPAPHRFTLSVTVQARIPGPLQAILLDVDGTLYHQSPVRRTMGWRLARAYWMYPSRAMTTLRVLRAYRRAQEALRTSTEITPDLSATQLQLAARWTDTPEVWARECVSRWMHQEPLGLLRRARRDGVVEFLERARKDGVRLAAVSDYPAAAKLSAMEIGEFFEVVISAHDRTIGRFKPDPLGIEVALSRLGIDREKALYIGDRPDIDATAAERAGVACVILGRQAPAPGLRWIGLQGFRDLHGIVFHA